MATFTAIKNRGGGGGALGGVLRLSLIHISVFSEVMDAVSFPMVSAPSDWP